MADTNSVANPILSGLETRRRDQPSCRMESQPYLNVYDIRALYRAGLARIKWHKQVEVQYLAITHNNYNLTRPRQHDVTSYIAHLAGRLWSPRAVMTSPSHLSGVRAKAGTLIQDIKDLGNWRLSAISTCVSMPPFGTLPRQSEKCSVEYLDSGLDELVH